MKVVAVVAVAALVIDSWPSNQERMRRRTTGTGLDGRDSLLKLSCYTQRQVLSISQSGDAGIVATLVMADLELTHKPRLGISKSAAKTRGSFPLLRCGIETR